MLKQGSSSSVWAGIQGVSGSTPRCGPKIEKWAAAGELLGHFLSTAEVPLSKVTPPKSTKDRHSHRVKVEICTKDIK